jgi:transposase
MPAKNHLSKEQREKFLRELKEKDDAYVRNKILILLLMKDILARFEAEMPNIIPEFLPAYSPDYNLIQLVWH